GTPVNTIAVGFAPHAAPTRNPQIAPLTPTDRLPHNAASIAPALSASNAISLYASEPVTMVQGVTSTRSPTIRPLHAHARTSSSHLSAATRAHAPHTHAAMIVINACRIWQEIAPIPSPARRPMRPSAPGDAGNPMSNATCVYAASTYPGRNE